MKAETKLRLLLGLFVGFVVGMNFLGGKIISLFGVSVSVAIFMVPITFLVTDIVAEVYGQKVTREFVYVAVGVLVLMFFFSWIFVSVTPHERYPHNQSYALIFGSSMRIIFASGVAFVFSQLHDIWAFEFWKGKTNGKHLWLRNNASTMMSQLVDTTLFMFIAFYGVTPKYDTKFIASMIVPFYLFKVAFAALDTPFVYAGVRWLRGNKTPKATETKDES